jgi:hypothetical protein
MPMFWWMGCCFNNRQFIVAIIWDLKGRLTSPYEIHYYWLGLLRLGDPGSICFTLPRSVSFEFLISQSSLLRDFEISGSDGTISHSGGQYSIILEIWIVITWLGEVAHPSYLDLSLACLHPLSLSRLNL